MRVCVFVCLGDLFVFREINCLSERGFVAAGTEVRKGFMLYSMSFQFHI